MMWRIIPARAGFTVAHFAHLSSVRDHPRSRGVYGTGGATTGEPPGSSPLARGLPEAIYAAKEDLGIIPARAGFTLSERRRWLAGTDHPRSRGVYLQMRVLDGSNKGSSPLARGLLLYPVLVRAMFSDHPRSRGVYIEEEEDYEDLPGSSPLARGLRAFSGKSSIVGRIIPARAGFTCVRVCACVSFSDHPRSRGVYSASTVKLLPVPGSSPLARGLRDDVGGSHCEFRIIPARAGFTWTPTSASWTLGDHPRSRGVYIRDFRGRLSPGGSSPLARGLPLDARL